VQNEINAKLANAVQEEVAKVVPPAVQKEVGAKVPPAVKDEVDKTLPGAVHEKVSNVVPAAVKAEYQEVQKSKLEELINQLNKEYKEFNNQLELLKNQHTSNQTKIRKQITEIQNLYPNASAQASGAAPAIQATLMNIVKELDTKLQVQKEETEKKIENELGGVKRTLGLTQEELREQSVLIQTLQDKVEQHDRKEQMMTPSFQPSQISQFSQPQAVPQPALSQSSISASSLPTSSGDLAVDLSRIVVTGDGHKKARINTPATFNVSFYNQFGLSVSGGQDLTVAIQGPSTPQAQLTNNSNGSVSVTYTIATFGDYEIAVKYKNSHIPGSPFHVGIARNYQQMSKPIKTISREANTLPFERPWSVTFDNDGLAYISDLEAHKIFVLSKDFVLLRQFGEHGTEKGHLEFPRGIAWNPANQNIYICDSGANRISVFASNGTFQSTFGKGGYDHGQFNVPRGIAVDPSGEVYVADTDNSRVQVFDVHSNFIRSFGREGTAQGELKYPLGVAINNKTKQIVVSDCDNHRIQVFALDGTFKFAFGKFGKGDGEFDKPAGVACDPQGNIFVTDMQNHRVQIFTQDGNFLANFGKKGNQPGEFDEPRGIAIDKEGRIFVSDFSNRRIEVF